MLVLFCLAAPLALLTGWARMALLTTDGYVATIGGLAGNAQVQAALARSVMSLVDEAMLGATPSATSVEIAAAASSAAADAALSIMASAAFMSLWEEANRELHSALVLLLDRPSGEPAVLDLSPLLPLVQQELAINQITLPGDLALADEELRLELVDARTADTIRRYADYLQITSWALLAVALTSLALLIGLAHDRLQVIIRAGYGLAAGMAVLLIVSLVVQRMAISAAASSVADLLDTLVATLTQDLRIATLGLALTGLAFAAVSTKLRTLHCSASIPLVSST